MLVGAYNTHLLTTLDEPSAHRVSSSLHSRHSPIGWIISGCVSETEKSFQLLQYEPLKVNISVHEFDDRADDEKLMVSNDDHLAIEIVERTIKRVDQYKFQIAVPFRHIKVVYASRTGSIMTSQ